jgi:hypothetical protein
MAEKNRAILKNYFLKGSVPKEEHFHDLIDSLINQVDDNLRKKEGEPFKLKAEGPNEDLITFFKNIDDLKPNWSISQKSAEGNPGLNISDSDGNSRFFIEQGGNVGIGTIHPQSRLHVNGVIGMEGRRGTYATGEVPADGTWHNIVTRLNEYNALEVVAVVGVKGAHAITHAIAVSSYGKSRGKINKTQGYYGKSRNRIDLRWTGSYYDYQMQVRTCRNLGEGVFISYNVTRLF